LTACAELALNGQDLASCYVADTIYRSQRVNNSALVVSIVAMLGSLFLVSRGMPGRSWPVVIAATLAVVFLVVFLEQNGYWPASFTLRR